TDHVHRVGRPKESIKGVRLRLAAEAYKNADMARDPLDDGLTYALYVLAHQKAAVEPLTLGAFDLGESAFLQAVRLKVDASDWPRKNWFSRAVKDRIDDLAQLGVKVTADRTKAGQVFTITLLPKVEGGDAIDA